MDIHGPCGMYAFEVKLEQEVFVGQSEPCKTMKFLNSDIQEVNTTLRSHSIVLPRKWHICNGSRRSGVEV